MKKIILSIVILVCSVQYGFGAYTLSSNDTIAVNKAVILIEKHIENQGEILRTSLLGKISIFLEKNNLSEKNRAILDALQEELLIKKDNTVSVTETIEDSEYHNLPEKNGISEENTHLESIPEIDPSSDFEFIFEEGPHRCDTNPCKIEEDFVKIKGSVDTEEVKYIEINDYRLQSYTGDNWEYNANVDFGNLEEGENIYEIFYLSEEEDVLHSEKYVITRVITEEEKKTINSENTIQSDTYVDVSSNNTFDENEARKYWLGLLNSVRKSKGVSPYSYDSSLDSTAKKWSDLAVSRGYIDHRINTGDSYYDYNKKVSWMKNNGVVCENVNRITFSESIAWGKFSCSSNDCTSSVKKVMDDTFNFYMSEEGKSYAPHFNAMINPYFESIGLGLGLKSQGNNSYKLFLTNHYCTTNIK